MTVQVAVCRTSFDARVHDANDSLLKEQGTAVVVVANVLSKSFTAT